MNDITVNGHRIHVSQSGIGAFYETTDPTEVPRLVTGYYCSICARERNGESQDGEADCIHKSLLRFATKVLNGNEDAEASEELAAFRTAARNGTL